MSVMVSQITENARFVQQFVQANATENIKVLHYWPFAAKFTGHQWIPHTCGQ